MVLHSNKKHSNAVFFVLLDTIHIYARNRTGLFTATLGGVMKPAHLFTPDLAHQAKYAMTEGQAQWAAEEFVKRADTTLQQYYAIIADARFDKVKCVAENGLMKHKEATSGDLAWLTINAHTDDIALAALCTLTSRPDVTASKWHKLVHEGKNSLICLRAEEQLVAHAQTSSDDLLWLEDHGKTAEIKENARRRLCNIFG